MTTRRFSRFRSRFSLVAAFAFATASALFSAAVPNAVAQGIGQRPNARPIPTDRYYAGVQLIETGAFSTAINFYQSELKSAERIGTTQWLDSICYYAMLGEALYQAGDLNAALENYKAALTTSLAFPNWLSRVGYTTGVSTTAKSAAPWGSTERVCPIGVFPKTAIMTVGDVITEDRLKQGGVMKEQEARKIDPAEILRCVALSIRRRTEILGPLAAFDPMSEQILSAYSNRSVPPNHWSVTWLDVLFGLALSESGKPENARRVLHDALLMNGQYDHQLTAVALLELGNLYMKSSQVREATKCYYEASISAFNFGDLLLVEEALRNYSNAAKALGDVGSRETTTAAFAWAKAQKRPLLSASIGLELVEELIYAGKTKLASSGLASIEASIRSSASAGLRTSRAADRWNYLNALLFYSTGNMSDGDAALAKVVEGMKSRSPWTLQLLRLDNYVKKGLTSNGPLTPRNAADLYEYLLREPTVVDWAFQPTESLAIQMIAPPGAYERWFQILFERDLKDKAFEVSERIRRERFFSTQTYGGRLVSLRYLLTADEALTTTSIRAARQKILIEYPRFDELTKEARTISDALNEFPTVPKDEDARKKQTELLTKLGAVSTEQEALLRLIAASRIRIPYVFPPVLSLATVQKRLPPDTAALAFLDANGETFGMMIGKNNFDAWRVGATERVGAAVATFLRTIGCSDGSRQVEGPVLSEAYWKTQGSKLREIILGASDVDSDRFNIHFSKLVVVPDSVLWYLPFEALCLPAIAAETEENADAETDENAATESSETDATNDRPIQTESQEDVDAASVQTNAQTNAAPSDETTTNDEADAPDALDALFDATSDAEPERDDAETPANDDAEKDDATAPNDDETQNDSAAAFPKFHSAKTSQKQTARVAVSQDETTSEENAATTSSDETSAKPAKRKSSSARKKEALDAYENSLIPMIQAPDLTIRYSATVGLALPNALGRNAFVETTILGGETFPKQTTETLDAALQRFETAIPKTEAARVGALLDVSGGLYASRLKRLVVWDEILGDVWNWEPFVPGKTRRGNGVADWIYAPWGAPRLLVLPALRTSAEEAMKNGGIGLELFLPILAMQSSGADAMLLSRWRTGGRSAFDLTTDFVKNYETQPVADAWKNAVSALRERDVVVEEEPRLRKPGRSDPTPKYDLPFWWSGYLLVDSGEAIGADEIEKFDAENVKKMTAENATLEGLKTDANVPEGTAPAGTTPQNPADPNANAPVGTTPTSTDAVPNDDGPKIVDKTNEKEGTDDSALDFGPQVLDDDALQKSDEAGEDFFENDDAKPADETDSKDDAKPADDK